MNKPVVTLRDMTEGDIALIVNARNESKEFLTIQNSITYDDGKHYWEKVVSTGLIDVYIILADGVPCGFIDYKRIECNIGIKVLEKFRGGIGKTALELAFKEIRRREPMREILADIKLTNLRMINTAYKCGFEFINDDGEYTHWRVPLEWK